MNFVKKHPLLTAFLIPFFICIIICIGNGVYPFGDYCLLHMDLYHQYLPFFNELWEKLRNGASLMYTWNIGLGSDFVSVFAYYLASPLNWLVVLFPKSHIIEFIELLIISKISLSGATFFYFLKEHFVLLGKDNRYHNNTFVSAFVFSTAYALSGFVAAYTKFTLVGATTRAGLLTAPLRDRFGMIHHLEFYTIEELQQIIMHSARILDVEIEPAGAKEMARRSRGTPRLANRILKRVRDFAQVKYDGIITEEVARTALDLMDVDKMGLDHIDRNILVTIIEKFDGGPVGLDTLAAAIGEDAGTIEDVYEPYLIKNGFLNRTPKGRVVTDLTYHHLGLN